MAEASQISSFPFPSDSALDTAIADMCDRMKIPLGKILCDNGPFAPYGMCDFVYDITLPRSEKIMKAQANAFIAKPYRMNISRLVTFYNACKDDMKYIFNNYLNIEKDEEKGIIDTLKNNDYARLEILTTRPYTHQVIIP